jgi:hypothetical protein
MEGRPEPGPPGRTRGCRSATNHLVVLRRPRARGVAEPPGRACSDDPMRAESTSGLGPPIFDPRSRTRWPKRCRNRLGVRPPVGLQRPRLFRFESTSGPSYLWPVVMRARARGPPLPCPAWPPGSSAKLTEISRPRSRPISHYAVFFMVGAGTPSPSDPRAGNGIRRAQSGRPAGPKFQSQTLATCRMKGLRRERQLEEGGGRSSREEPPRHGPRGRA